jgi:hypothetical protein
MARPGATPSDSGVVPIDTLTVIRGLPQNDRTWEIVGSHDPFPGAAIVASARLLDGSGRIERRERFTTVSTTWRATRRTSVGWNWSWRRARSRAAMSEGDDGTPAPIETEMTETVRGLDVSGWLPGDFRVRGSIRSVSNTVRKSATYGVTLDKSF